MQLDRSFPLRDAANRPILDTCVSNTAIKHPNPDAGFARLLRQVRWQF